MLCGVRQVILALWMCSLPVQARSPWGNVQATLYWQAVARWGEMADAHSRALWGPKALESRSTPVSEELPSQEKHKRLCEEVCHCMYVSVGWPYVGGLGRQECYTFGWISVQCTIDSLPLHSADQRGARTEGFRFWQTPHIQVIFLTCLSKTTFAFPCALVYLERQIGLKDAAPKAL